MTIQLNAGKNLSIHEAFGEKLKAIITEDLSRFVEHITRIEVHLSDENSTKNGQNDKRCMLEARLEGRQPIAVTANANNHEEAVTAAVVKLKTSLDTVLGRMRNY